MKLGTFVATCENLEATPEVADPVVHAENTTELIESEAVSDAGFKETEDYDTGMTDAITTMDRLEEARDTVAAADSPDASSVEIATVESLLGNIRHTLGLGDSVSTLESLSINKRQELVATMESAMESVKNAIINGLKAAWEAVKRFINQLFQNKEALRKYLASVNSKLEAADGELGAAEHAGFNSADSCEEALRTGSAMFEIIQATADSFADILSKDKSEVAQANGDAVARVIGTKSNDILNRSTKIQGKSEDGKPLRGYASNGKGLRIFTEGDGLTYERPVKYSEAKFALQRLNVQAAKDLIRQASALLERLATLKKFENTFAGVFKFIGNLIGSGYNRFQGRPQKGQQRTPEQQASKQEANKKVMVAAFRGIAHVYGSAMPRDIFLIISNIGKYVDACVGAKTSSATQTAAA